MSCELLCFAFCGSNSRYLEVCKLFITLTVILLVFLNNEGNFTVTLLYLDIFCFFFPVSEYFRTWCILSRFSENVLISLNWLSFSSKWSMQERSTISNISRFELSLCKNIKFIKLLSQ